MTYPTQEEVSDLDNLFKKHPEIFNQKSDYEVELELLNQKLQILKEKGIIVGEKKPNQEMVHKLQ